MASFSLYTNSLSLSTRYQFVLEANKRQIYLIQVTVIFNSFSLPYYTNLQCSQTNKDREKPWNVSNAPTI
jgi:hypothetical protein